MANSGSSDLRRASGGEKYDLEACANTILLDELCFEPNNGSQKGFMSWENQDNPSSSGEMMNQIGENPFNFEAGLASTHAGIRSAARKYGSNNGTRRRNTGKNPVYNERKRETDKKYRDKCREAKKQMENDLRELGRENVHLDDENKKLMMEKASINNSLESASTETNQLRIEIRNLKSNMASQQILVDSFLKKLDVSSSSHDINHQLEIKKLENEILVLRQNNWEDWFMNKLQLVHEIENLEHENKILKVQVDALCEKINNDNDHGDTKASEW